MVLMTVCLLPATIKKVLKEGLNRNMISQEEYIAMNPEDGNPAKFYCNFKIQKDHTINKAPPQRPIISGSGSILENIGKYVEFYIHNIATKHESFLPHFFKTIEEN